MNLPAPWAGAAGHVLSEPTVPEQIIGSFSRLIDVLEVSAPPGLAATRNQFRAQGQINAGNAKFMSLSETQRTAVAMDQILTLRFELLVAAQLQRAGALTRIRTDTPDFDCRWGKAEFGVEATTRARPEVTAALHDAMEKRLEAGPDVDVMLDRTGAVLFAESPAVVADIADRVAGDIESAVAAAADQPFSNGTVPVPELGLNARWTTGAAIGLAGARVRYESALMWTKAQWAHHWKMAALQVKDTIEKKGKKSYSLPSIVVVDVSRLGETSRLLTDEGIAAFQAVVDGCDLGNLKGALLVRSVMTAETLVPVCWRLVDEPAGLAVAAVILGEHGKPLVDL